MSHACVLYMCLEVPIIIGLLMCDYLIIRIIVFCGVCSYATTIAL